MNDAVIVAEPSPTAVTLPLLTVATLVLLLLHVTVWPCGEVLAEMVSDCPTYMDEILVRDKVTPESATVTRQVAV